MTGYEDFNHSEFISASIYLREEQNLAVHNPAKSFGGRVDLESKTYLRHDINLVLESSAIIFLPGWEDSAGATVEAYVARAIDLPMYLLTNIGGYELERIHPELHKVGTPRLQTTSKEELREWVDNISGNSDEPLLLADGFEDCILGVINRFGSEPHICYHMPSVLKRIQADGLTEEDALEHFNYNVIGAWAGDATPAFLDTP